MLSKIINFQKAKDETECSHLSIFGKFFSISYEKHFWACCFFNGLIGMSYGHEILKNAQWIDYSISTKYIGMWNLHIFGTISWYPKCPLHFTVKLRRTRFSIELAILGTTLNIVLGHMEGTEIYKAKQISYNCEETTCLLDFYDSHTDKYYEYSHWYQDKGIVIYTDKSQTKEVQYSHSRAVKYKEFYLSKGLKIYNEDWLNCLWGRTIEVALPHLYYLTTTFEKPFWHRDLLGFEVKLNFKYTFTFLTKLTFLHNELSVCAAKNRLDRPSNLYSCASIKRYFDLRGAESNPVDKDAFTAYDNLMEHRKTAQFKYLTQYVSVKPFLRNKSTDGYANRCRFYRPIFDCIYGYLCQYRIIDKTFEGDEDYFEPYAVEKLKTLYQWIKSKRKKKGAKND